MASRRNAFTILEMLVVVSIMAALVGILLPAIGRARGQAHVTTSQANLRNLATAHATYAAAWNDRQLTFIDDNASTYGGFHEWFANYAAAHGSDMSDPDHPGNHPMVILGRGHKDGRYGLFGWPVVHAGNASMCMPLSICQVHDEHRLLRSFRYPNAGQFNQYVSGRFYDPVFYAPRDRAVTAAVATCFDSPDQFCIEADVPRPDGDAAWSSYCLSPAAMFAPAVFARDDPADDTLNGFTDPFDLPGGFRSPAFSQCTYAALKTHLLEHHWLQNNPAGGCNPGFDGGSYGAAPGCEPYYFNHAWESSPVTLFYDGHVEMVGVDRAMRADARVRRQTGRDGGLWSRDTPWGEDGYLIQYGYDQAATSFHILTTDGIRGRDVLAE